MGEIRLHPFFIKIYAYQFEFEHNLFLNYLIDWRDTHFVKED